MQKLWGVFSMVCLTFVLVTTAKGATMTITDGKTVKIDYTLTVDGKVADTSKGKKPLEYVQGKHMIIPGLESQLKGLKVGDTKHVVVSPEDGYGKVNPKLVVQIPKKNLNSNTEPQVGMVLEMTTPDGQKVPGVIKAVDGDTLTVDFNHPLAGKELDFDIKVVDIS